MHTIHQCTVVVEGGVVTGGLQVIKSYTKVKLTPSLHHNKLKLCTYSFLFAYVAN